MLPLILVRISTLSLPPLSLAVGVIAVVAIAYLFFVFKVRRASKTSGSTSPGALPSDTSARRIPTASPPTGGTVQMTEADAALVRALRKADIYFGGLQVAAPKPPKPAFHPEVAVSTRAKA